TVTLIVGSSFVDSGAIAMDNLDGDISKRITKSGSLNTSRIGTYTLRYDVSDKAGNAALTKKRTIDVTGDPVAGAKFASSKCRMCHNLDTTANKTGPGLKGIFNRKAGGADGFSYGNTLSVASWKWSEANLRVWLGQPTKDAVRQVSGDSGASTRMNFNGASGADLDNLIAFLKGN
ncbi:MAG: hypothetical protein CO187_02955, partial [Zetaproteobacteria bacterium CG_4_9_14_3_um_filter_53_7]